LSSFASAEPPLSFLKSQGQPPETRKGKEREKKDILRSKHIQNRRITLVIHLLHLLFIVRARPNVDEPILVLDPGDVLERPRDVGRFVVLVEHRHLFFDLLVAVGRLDRGFVG
jgi:hypothetical protein